MAKYDRQLIMLFLNGGMQVEPMLAQAKALNEKERIEALETEMMTIRRGTQRDGVFEGAGVEALRQALTGRLQVSLPVTTSSRVYLVGSGDWQHKKLSGWLPEEVADLLGQAGMPSVKVISIVADGLGRGAADPARSGSLECMDSFAALFHRRLKETWQIRTVVNARVVKVAVVLSAADRSTTDGEPAYGRKVTLLEGETLEGETLEETLRQGHHRPHTKVKFAWEADVQRAEWAY